MSYPWMPNSSRSFVEEMLTIIGVKSTDELYSDIPRELFLDEHRWNSLPIGAGRPLSEVEVSAIVEDRLGNVTQPRIPPFAGGGVRPHYVPPVVTEIVRRGEFLTAYTPYQAEVSQGLQQALFEYQSLMADLLEMDVVNSSMYDWASALGEAALMAVRVKGIKRVLVPDVINPFHLSTLKVYAWPQDIEIEFYATDRSTGYANLEDVKEKLSNGGASAVYMELPYTFTGIVDLNARGLAEVSHDAGALFVVGLDPITAGLYKPPGELDADIAVGEGQPLGLGVYAGGSTLGIFAVKWDGQLIKQMPGRIIGLTTTKDGSSRAFTMILQTREQHIRRSKATSNITTNAALNAIAAAVYLSLLGPKGIKELAEAIWHRAHYAAQLLTKAGYKLPLSGEFFEDFIVETRAPYRDVWLRLFDKGIMAGLPLSSYVSWASERWGLLSFSELHSKNNIEELVSSMMEVDSH
ncbi:MAG: aminomethyl-transferring glycine dehydrogenase subunit GcvPA [Acidilobus sp.]